MEPVRGTWRFTDRTRWPSGPWDHEPDKIEWRDSATGLPCIARRGTSGAWCGYVAVPSDHPWYGVEYNHGPDEVIEVHGGLTFSDFCNEDDVEHGVCHVPLEGEEARVWWFGFDCAHCFDLCPGHIWVHEQIRKENPQLADYEPREEYRDLDYVRSQITKLAHQLWLQEPVH